MSSRSPLLNVMSAAAIKAGRGLIRDFSEVDKLQISRKGTANFVTAADHKSEKVLQAELSKARPGYSFLMEESGEVAGQNKEFRWVIDPIDGTTNFIHAIPYFSISIALERTFPNGKIEVVAGVIYDPIHNDLFCAEKHQGAYLNDRRIQVSPRKDLDAALITTGAPRAGHDGYDLALNMIHAVTETSAGVRFYGSAALDLANVAAGRLDGFWHSALKRWDIAAGLLLVQEAGGMVSPIAPGTDALSTGGLFASNALIHESVLKILRKTVKDQAA